MSIPNKKYRRPPHLDSRKKPTMELQGRTKSGYDLDKLRLSINGCMSLVLVLCLMICIFRFSDLRDEGFEVLKAALLMLFGYIAGGRNRS